MYHPTPSSPDLVYNTAPRKGKHKIFIGMAPGVGKTYKMLEEGHCLKREGIDVIIGLLETHKRKETAEKAIGLEVVPRKHVMHAGIVLEEMDTDAILKRCPQLVLVDELAHTNVPGSEREKRYQDVEVLLNAGIDVYSTVNIQHQESLNDLVARITGVVVRERVPDRMIESADEIVVVDVTPETLQERLQDGKIYAPEKIEQSLQNFFQRGNLIALRELALREIANNVEAHGIDAAPTGQFCNIHERVLVCISTNPNSAPLLRRGARIADYMKAPLYVLFVKTSDRFLTKTEALHVETCERLCKEFEGEFLRVTHPHVAEAIAQVAKERRITQVVLGKTQKPKWKFLLKGSLVDQLMRSLNQVDIHIIGTN
ncbi:MAG TPA: universal stress protein [Coleofasciculaceae cyanobacterium]